ncbi:transposase, partial [Microcystis aeruginosa]
IELIREKWPTTQILLRADSAYAREEIFKFCEEEDRVDYAIAMGTNNQLKLRASDIIEKSKRDYEQRLEPVVELMETLFAK